MGIPVGTVRTPAAWLGSFPNVDRPQCAGPFCRDPATWWLVCLVIGHGVQSIPLCSEHCEAAEAWLNKGQKGVPQDFSDPVRVHPTRGRLRAGPRVLDVI